MAPGIKTLKVAYVSLAFLAMLCAIAAAYFRQQYVALLLIVLASAIILCGSLLVSYMYKMEKAKELKKL
jgi:uncharacterized membrane protein